MKSWLKNILSEICFKQINLPVFPHMDKIYCLYNLCLYSNRRLWKMLPPTKSAEYENAASQLKCIGCFCLPFHYICMWYSLLSWTSLLGSEASHIYMLLISPFFIFHLLLINITGWKKNPSIKLSNMINGSVLAWEMGNANDWSI